MVKYAICKNRCRSFCDRWHIGHFNIVDTDEDEDVLMKTDKEKR